MSKIEINVGSVNLVEIDEASDGQRIDNYLCKVLKGVPKSHVYRILRSGEVRVNSKRVDANFKLSMADMVRIPPVRMNIALNSGEAVAEKSKLNQTILFEDEALLVIDKPAGFAVHGGSGVSRGVIEQLRAERPKAKFLELVHRLDRETSGVLLLAKKRAALVQLHEMIRNNQTDKRYMMMVSGQWLEKKKKVTMPLHKYVAATGERRVSVQEDGQHSETNFFLRKSFTLQGAFYSLLEAQLVTGRTHQLRVQLSHLGFPILGDDKYGDFALNKQLHKLGLKRMFLHSYETNLKHPVSAQKLKLIAPMPKELQSFINSLVEQTS